MHLEDNPLIFQAQKDNLLEISGQTLVPIIDIFNISSLYWYKIYSSITLSRSQCSNKVTWLIKQMILQIVERI